MEHTWTWLKTCSFALVNFRQTQVVTHLLSRIITFHRNTSALHSASAECYTRIWMEILTWGVFFLNKTGLLQL